MHETSCTIWWINQSEHYLIKCECNFFPLRLYYHKFNMILLPQKPCHTWLRFYILLLKELLFFVLFCFVLRYIFLSFLSRKNRQKSYLSSSKISLETNNTGMKRSRFWLPSIFTLSTFLFFGFHDQCKWKLIAYNFRNSNFIINSGMDPGLECGLIIRSISCYSYVLMISLEH